MTISNSKRTGTNSGFNFFARSLLSGLPHTPLAVQCGGISLFGSFLYMYMGISLIRNRPTPQDYRRPLGIGLLQGRFRVSEVPLYTTPRTSLAFQGGRTSVFGRLLKFRKERVLY